MKGKFKMGLMMGEGRRLMDKALLDGVEKLRGHGGSEEHVPVDQRLQLQLLPLSHAEITPHPFNNRRKKNDFFFQNKIRIKKNQKEQNPG